MENGAVAGLVASDADGYVKITCKAVVCACGGMGGNPFAAWAAPATLTWICFALWSNR